MIPPDISFFIYSFTISRVSSAASRLWDGDVLEHAYLVEPRQEYTIQYHDKPYALNKVKLAKRDTKGMKPRI